MANQYKTIHPVKYYREFLANQIRPDGRGLLKFRPSVLNVGSVTTADGSALVKIGNSTVVCGIKAELASPKPEEPDQGMIIPNVTLPPLCSPKFRPGPPSGEAQVATQFVADVIANTACINLKELCVEPDHLCWVLHVDLICINHDGSVLDACMIALMGALRSVQLPEVTFDVKKDVTSVNLENKRPISVYSCPIAVTFAIFDGELIIADPTAEEESLCSGVVTVVVQRDKLSSIHKPGGSPLTEEQLQDCITAAQKQAEHVCELVRMSVESIAR